MLSCLWTGQCCSSNFQDGFFVYAEVRSMPQTEFGSDGSDGKSIFSEWSGLLGSMFRLPVKLLLTKYIEIPFELFVPHQVGHQQFLPK